MSKKLTLTEKTTEELATLLGEKREELRKLRFAAAGARPADASLPKKTRKDIARILTQMTAQKTN